MKRPDVLLVFLTRFEECTAMLKGIAHFERTHNIWTAYHDDEAISETDPRWIRSKRWQGVISRHTTAKLVRTCAELRVPLVDLNDGEVFPGVPKIRPDNDMIGRQGAEHLLERGFKSFIFAGFSSTSWSGERRDGFVEEVIRSGNECDVFDVEFPKEGPTPFWVEDQTRRLSEWLKKLPKPSGLMACSDLRAQQLVNAANAAGILVPEEVAILGANNDTVRCELANPPLSSVAPNAFQSGYCAAEALSDMLAGRRPKAMDQRVEPLGVIARRSTDILAVDDEHVAAALNFIRENACRHLTMDQVVKYVHTSRSQLEQKFRKNIGRSPKAEIRRVQLMKIEQLLLETELPLRRVADMAGFDHVEYMCVSFKRMTGLSPGEFREKRRSKSVVPTIGSAAFPRTGTGA